VGDLPPGPAGSIRDLVERQEETMQSIDRDSLEQEIQEDTDEDLTPEELASQVEVKIRQQRAEYVASTLSMNFSPDGTKLLVTSAGPGDRYFLDLVDLTTGVGPLTLSTTTGWIPSSSFSPDGQQILFESDLPFDSNRGGGRLLYLANSDGSDKHRVVDEDVLGACWHWRAEK